MKNKNRGHRSSYTPNKGEEQREKKNIRAVDRGTQGAVMRPAKVKKKWGNKNHFELI